MISSKLDLPELREADRLGRYALRPVLLAAQDSHLWLIGLSAVVLTVVNLRGGEHESWKGILGMYALVLGALALRSLWIDYRMRTKLRKLNATDTGLELTPLGVRFHMPDGKVNLGRWEKYPEARVGRRVLLIYYWPPKQKLKRRKYFIVPLQGLSRAERQEVLLTIPEEIRGKSLRKELQRWRRM